MSRLCLYTQVMCDSPYTRAVPCKVPGLHGSRPISSNKRDSRGLLADTRPCLIATITGATSAAGRVACGPSEASAMTTPCAAADGAYVEKQRHLDAPVFLSEADAAAGPLQCQDHVLLRGLAADDDEDRCETSGRSCIQISAMHLRPLTCCA